MTATATKTKGIEMARTAVAQAREYDRRGDVVLRDQTARQIEAIPGLSRKQIAEFRAMVFAAAE